MSHSIFTCSHARSFPVCAASSQSQRRYCLEGLVHALLSVRATCPHAGSGIPCDLFECFSVCLVILSIPSVFSVSQASVFQPAPRQVCSSLHPALCFLVCILLLSLHALLPAFCLPSTLCFSLHFSLLLASLHQSVSPVSSSRLIISTCVLPTCISHLSLSVFLSSLAISLCILLPCESIALVLQESLLMFSVVACWGE